METEREEKMVKFHCTKCGITLEFKEKAPITPVPCIDECGGEMVEIEVEGFRPPSNSVEDSMFEGMMP